MLMPMRVQVSRVRVQGERVLYEQEVHDGVAVGELTALVTSVAVQGWEVFLLARPAIPAGEGSCAEHGLALGFDWHDQAFAHRVAWLAGAAQERARAAVAGGRAMSVFRYEGPMTAYMEEGAYGRVALGDDERQGVDDLAEAVFAHAGVVATDVVVGGAVVPGHPGDRQPTTVRVRLTLELLDDGNDEGGAR